MSFSQPPSSSTFRESTLDTANGTLIYRGGFLPRSIDKRLIKTVVVEEGVTAIAGEKNLGRSGAFHSCLNLVTVILSASCKVIEMNAFRSSPSLTGIVVNDQLTQIQGYAFYNCQRLVRVPIPDCCSVDQNSFYDSRSLFILARLANITINQYCRHQWRNSKLKEFKANLMLCYKYFDNNRVDVDDPLIDKTSILWVLYARIESDDVKRRIVEYLDWTWMV